MTPDADLIEATKKIKQASRNCLALGCEAEVDGQPHPFCVSNYCLARDYEKPVPAPPGVEEKSENDSTTKN